jgi:S1-C subfamily serine protease
MLTTVIFVLAAGATPKADAHIENLRSAEVKPGGSLASTHPHKHMPKGELEMVEAPIEIIEMAPVMDIPQPAAPAQSLADSDVDAESFGGDQQVEEKPDLSVLLPEIMAALGAEAKAQQTRHNKKMHKVHRRGDDDDDEDETETEGGTHHSGPSASASASATSGEGEGETETETSDSETETETETGGNGAPNPSQYNELRYGIVRIQTVVQVKNLMTPYNPSEGEESFVGTGFVIKKVGDENNDPLVVTNAHVVSDAKSVCMQLPANGQQCYKSDVRLINHDYDLALLRVVDKKQLAEDLGNHDLKVLSLSSVQEDHAAEQGTPVLALGFPLGKETLALTSGTISGIEVVGDNVALQQDAPISPGNSGGPLVRSSDNKVVGVNFASAVAMGSQNNNFAIPAYRVVQMMAQYTHHQKEYADENCHSDIEKCEMHIPSTGATVVKGTDILYNYYGCEEGALLSKVSERSSFAHADPPIKENSFITKVGDTKLDRFGMGTNSDYIQDKVKFNDLMYMTENLDEPTEVETCHCGKVETHTVSHQWKDEYEGPVKADDQANLVERDYVRFANITMQPLTKSLAHHLILQQGELQLIPYIMEENKEEEAVIITDVGSSELGVGGRKSISVGGVIDEINGKKITKFSDIAEAFRPACHGSHSQSCTSSFVEDVFTTTAPKTSFLEEEDDTNCNRVWTMKTKDGKFVATDYKAELTHMTHGDNRFAISDVVKEALTTEGISLPSTLAQQKEETKIVFPKDPTPIEYRNTFRGGMTVDKALKKVVERGVQGGVPSSFMEMGPSAMEPLSLMQIHRNHPSSFIEMGPGGIPGPAAMSLMQLHKNKAHPSSLIEMGPGAMEPESLMQIQKKK